MSRCALLRLALLVALVAGVSHAGVPVCEPIPVLFTRSVKVEGRDVVFVEVPPSSAHVLVVGRDGDDPWVPKEIERDRSFWISQQIIRDAFPRVPPLPADRLEYLPAWLTAHRPGNFRFATVEEVCVATYGCAIHPRPAWREVALVDAGRPTVWRWIMPYPISRNQATRELWRLAFEGCEAAMPRRIDFDERLWRARLVWTPP
jgi:hypothetical protein